MHSNDIARLIEAALKGTRAIVRSDDGTHFEAVVISPGFAGKRPLQRHQMVYAALGARMGGEIHALSIRACTPEEWRVIEPEGATKDAGKGRAPGP
ncbi:MAG: BolA/IbaG family iron-sulfur metabolism protein [Gammaproteobacteria bacterium]|nr:BolA/IbaG family iron-sulfur metabolism protein [Gammaproteobacteria bacterium]